PGQRENYRFLPRTNSPIPCVRDRRPPMQTLPQAPDSTRHERAWSRAPLRWPLDAPARTHELCPATQNAILRLDAQFAERGFYQQAMPCLRGHQVRDLVWCCRPLRLLPECSNRRRPKLFGSAPARPRCEVLSYSSMLLTTFVLAGVDIL